MANDYRYALSVTSQFPFCSVPLRLDAYSKCQFACRYCFAAARGGSRPEGGLQIASSSSLDRQLARAKAGHVGAVSEMLRSDVPIHFGGMSDPFPPMEDRSRVSLALLEVLASRNYPAIVSAKGVPKHSALYIHVLRAGRFLVQFSFTGVDPDATRAIDAGVPLLEARLAFMAELAAVGVPVAVRLQPVFPGHEKHAARIIERCAAAGARHVAVEFLKYPVESGSQGGSRLAAVDGGAVLQRFLGEGSKRVGREWILPVAYRAGMSLQLRNVARSAGMTFAFADNDLLHFSDGTACCTAADIHLNAPGMRFNFQTAVKRALPTGEITFSTIAGEWRPSGSIAQYINSNSRGRGRTIEQQIKAGWNGSQYSPASFYGVADTGCVDAAGLKIYALGFDERRMFREVC